MKTWKLFTIFLIFTIFALATLFIVQPEQDGRNLNETGELNFSALTDEDIIEYAMKNDEFKTRYEGWDFRIVEKRLIERNGKKSLSIDMYTGKNNWTIVNHVRFMLNERCKLENLTIYEWVKPFVPKAASNAEKEQIISTILNDSRVKEVINGREFSACVNKLVNVVTGEDTGVREVLININNSSETYYMVIENGEVKSVKRTR